MEVTFKTEQSVSPSGGNEWDSLFQATFPSILVSLSAQNSHYISISDCGWYIFSRKRYVYVASLLQIQLKCSEVSSAMPQIILYLSWKPDIRRGNCFSRLTSLAADRPVTFPEFCGSLRGSAVLMQKPSIYNILLLKKIIPVNRTLILMIFCSGGFLQFFLASMFCINAKISR